RQRRVVVGRRKDRYVVTRVEQRFGEVLDMVLHPARYRERVRANHADSHSTNTRCNICQSAGASRIAVLNASAMPCVIVLTPSGDWSMGIGSCSRSLIRSWSYELVIGINNAPVRCASSAGPAGNRAFAPRSSTSTP